MKFFQTDQSRAADNIKDLNDQYARNRRKAEKIAAPDGEILKKAMEMVAREYHLRHI